MKSQSTVSIHTSRMRRLLARRALDSVTHTTKEHVFSRGVSRGGEGGRLFFPRCG